MPWWDGRITAVLIVYGQARHHRHRGIGGRIDGPHPPLYRHGGRRAGKVFVVLHITPSAKSMPFQLLERAGWLPAFHPVDGEPVRPGHIHVAPPDHHLLVGDGRALVRRGPPSTPCSVPWPSPMAPGRSGWCFERHAGPWHRRSARDRPLWRPHRRPETGRRRVAGDAVPCHCPEHDRPCSAGSRDARSAHPPDRRTCALPFAVPVDIVVEAGIAEKESPPWPTIPMRPVCRPPCPVPNVPNAGVG